LSAGALPQTPLGELTALPRPPSWILGGLLLRGRDGKGREGEDGEGKGGKERGKGEGKGWGGDEAGSAPQAKAWPHQNYFPGAGAAAT